MRPHRNLSAAQLAGLGLLGNLIAIGVIAAPRQVLIHFGLFFGFVLYMTPVLLGLGLYLWAITQLKNGVQNGIWTEEQLTPLRRITLSPFFTAIMLALMGAFLLTIIFNLTSDAHRTRGWGWAAYLLLMFIQQLQMATKQSTAKAAGPTFDWSTLLPVRSDHWGER